MRLLWKSRHSLKYGRRLKERFGLIQLEQKRSIWVHTVSVGEMIAAKPLIKEIQIAYPAYPIILTTMTATAADQVDNLFGQTVRHYFVPYDLPDVMRRFLHKIQPKAVIVMETEIWPNLIYQCERHGIPVLLANARLSARSAAGYHRFLPFIADVVSKISMIAVQTAEEAKRFQWLGAKEQQMVVTGSMKFDQPVPASVDAKAAVFKSLWGNTRPVWVAASTHEGEEETVFEAHKAIKKQLANALLVIVPRHPERFSKVAALSRKFGFNTVLRSANQPCHADVDVVIGDSMGEMLSYYAASDVAFVGGSLVPVGGHNLLEPAALGIAAITGRYVFNFTEITNMLVNEKAVVQVADRQQLAAQVIRWLENSTARTQAGEYGRQVVKQNRGAVKKHLDLVKALMARD
jgi:3-deoxy-D-manno-octulosonic-acid transferase